MEFKTKFVINTFFWAAVALLAYGAYRFILPVLRPFLIGFIVAAVVQIPLRRIPLKDPRWKPLLSGALCTLFYILLVSLVTLIGFGLVNETRSLVMQAPDFFWNTIYPGVASLAPEVKAVLSPFDPELAQWVVDMGKELANKLAVLVTDLSAGAVKLVASGAASLPGVIIEIIVTVVSSYYMAADFDKVTKLLGRLIPPRYSAAIRETLTYMKQVILAYIKSYSVIFAVTFLELTVGMLILRVPYALAIAFGIALFDLMPVLGTGGILLPWTVIALILGNIPMAIGVFLLYIIITVVRQTIEPRIVGVQLGLHPLATLVAMILGLGLLGLVGMILFPVTLVAVVNMRKNRQEHPAAEEGV